MNPEDFEPGMVLANPNNWNDAVPYQEFAVRMHMDGDQAWFIINTKHGGGYTSGNELSNWLALGVLTSATE
jgi:hypothetical protein